MTKHLVQAFFIAATATLTWGGLHEASAIVEPPQNAQFEIPLAHPEHPVPATASGVTDAVRAIEDAVSARLGGTWQVPLMNRYSATPRYVLGSGVELGVSVATDAAAEAAARGIVRTNPEVFGAVSNELTVSNVRRGAGKVAVHYQQQFQGIDVWGARAHVTMTDSGRVFALHSNIFDGIDVNPVPTVSKARAIEIAKAGVLFDDAVDRIDGDATLLVLPVGVNATEVVHRLVWRIRVETAEPVGIWVTHVDAHDGHVAWRYNDVHFLDVSGSAQSDVQPSSYCDGSEVQTAPWLNVDVDGLGTITTDVDGNWNAGDGGAGSFGITADLEGPYCNVNNMGGPEGEFTGTAVAGTPLVVEFDGSNSQADERTVFDSISDVHDFFEVIDPGYGYSNQPIQANVSIAQTCNAFWNGTINFFVAGGGCANTGEIAGVVHHEFGHGVQNDLIGSQGNEGLGEGNSDILANFITGESLVARGFFNNCSGGLRNSDNTLQYPDDVSGQGVHNAGRVIAGFNWDTMMAMHADMGTEAGTLYTANLWHFSRLLEMPVFQPDQVIAYFIADDDDGNLINGTPEYENICEGATNHGFAEYCPEVIIGVFIIHTRIACTTDGSNLVVDAVVASTEAPIDASTVAVNYTINGGPLESISMTAGGGDDYTATLPAAESPSSFAYYITAEDILGNAGSSPQFAPLEQHRFDVATYVELMETDPAWTVDPDGTDTANLGIWERADPGGTGIQPEDDYTSTGTMCWVTGADGGFDGSDDVDNGTTTLQTKTYNLDGAVTALLRYFRFFSNDQGPGANDDDWVVQARNDGGPWVDVERTQDDQNAWVQVDFNLVGQLGGALGDVEVRFIASDTNASSFVEALVDDFKILAGYDGSVDVEIDSAPSGVPGASYLSDARPNPFNPRTTISYGIDADERVALAIYDVHGRMVRSLVNTTQSAGHYAVVWDGRDDAGRDVASGVYYGRVTAGAFSTSTKLNLLK